MEELISIIVPVYNVESYLHRCVKSIQNQSYKNLEIILVDDGSPDRCPQMCDEIQAKDVRVKVIHKVNGGLGMARNSGLEQTTGNYVTFIDSDDWISPDHIENLYRSAKDNEADVVIGAHTTVSERGREQHHHKLKNKVYEGNAIVTEVLLPLIGGDISDVNDVGLNSSSCMNLYKVDLITKNALRFRSERLAVAEDLFFNVDYFSHARRIVAIDEYGYFYFENTESISRKYDPMRFERTVNFYKTLRDQINQYDLTEKAGYRAERSFLMKTRVAIRHVVLSNMNRQKKIIEIRTMLENSLTHEVLQRYPVETFIPAMRVLSKWMRNKNATGVYYLMKFRESVKHNNFCVTLLRKIGLGRK